jgi:hypothetical protein
MSKKLIFFATVLFLSLSAFAKNEEFYTTVFNVIESQRSETLLVLSASDGRVYKTGKTSKG